MVPSSLPSDDLPQPNSAYSDYQWRWQLDESISKHFYDACSDELRSLLGRCEWFTMSHAGVLLLVVNCPNAAVNDDVVNAIASLGSTLGRFAQHAKVRVCPPPDLGTPLEIQVDEIVTYQDWPDCGAT
jgi:hypothetical protein